MSGYAFQVGHSRNKLGLYVGVLPGHKKKSLYWTEEGEFCARCWPLATVRDDVSAEIIEAFLSALHDPHAIPNLRASIEAALAKVPA